MKPVVRVLTHSPPAPGISGDRIRMFYLIRQLTARGWDVRVWSLVAADEPDGFADALRAVTSEVVLVPRDVGTSRRLLRFLRNVASRQAYLRDWFTSAASLQAAAEWLSDAGDEPIVVEQLFMLPFVPPPLLRSVVLDTQNVEAVRARSIATGDGQWIRRLAARSQLGPVARHEEDAARSVALVLAVSREEQGALERMAPGHVRLVPNGVNAGAVRPLTAPPRSGGLLFLGSLGYAPNVDAVRYFAREIAPLLGDTNARLTVVGSSPSRLVRELATRCPIPTTLAGYVRDLAPAFTGNRMMIVPLRHGAGTRLKILEALAWGLPVVTTTIGAEGLGATDGEHLLTADDPNSFAAAIRRVSVDDQLWMRLSSAGRVFVVEHFDWDRIGEAMNAAVEEVATGRAGDRRPTGRSMSSTRENQA